MVNSTLHLDRTGGPVASCIDKCASFCYALIDYFHYVTKLKFGCLSIHGAPGSHDLVHGRNHLSHSSELDVLPTQIEFLCSDYLLVFGSILTKYSPLLHICKYRSKNCERYFFYPSVFPCELPLDVLQSFITLGPVPEFTIT